MLIKGRFRFLCFSLIELLVVIAIIAILIAITLPAIQRVRDAANMAVSRSNLHQIGIAINDYTTTNSNRLPPGNWNNDPMQYLSSGPQLAYSSNSVPKSTGASYGDLFFALLPYMEQDSVGQISVQYWFEYDPTKNPPWYWSNPGSGPYGWLGPPKNVSGSTASAVTNQFKFLQSPGDPTLPAPSGSLSAVSYVANSLVFQMQWTSTYTYAPGSWQGGMTMDRIIDGPAQTVFVAEGLAICGPPKSTSSYVQTGPWQGYPYGWSGAGWSRTYSITRNPNIRGLVAVPHYNTYAYTTYGASSWTKGTTYYSSSQQTVPSLYTPNSGWNWTYYQQTGQWSPPTIQDRVSALKNCSSGTYFYNYGYGTGGAVQVQWRNNRVQVCMGDGSVRGVNANISSSSWQAANSPNGHDTPGSDF